VVLRHHWRDIYSGSFIVSPSVVVLSQTKRSSAGTSRSSCGAQDRARQEAYTNSSERCVLCPIKETKSQPIPVAVRSKASVFGRSLTGIVGSNSTGGMDVCVVFVVRTVVWNVK
jgi:hypothetical protein